MNWRKRAKFVTASMMAVMCGESICHAANLSDGLTGADRTRVVEVLGFGSTNRSLLSATPIGTDPGIRVGIVQSLVVTHDLKKMGSQNGNTPEVVPMPSIHIAKGLPMDTDIEFVMMPPAVLSYIEKYGASFGWTILNEHEYPVALSVRPHFSYGRVFSGDVHLWNYGINVSVSRDHVWWEPFAHVGYAMAQGCVRQSLMAGGAGGCSLEPAGVAGVGIKFNLPLTIVTQIDTHNLDPALSLFIGKDF